MFTKEWFSELDDRLRAMGQDSDSMSFDEIKSLLSNKNQMNPDQFADQAVYVILAGGFSQKTAKKVHQKIMSRLKIGNVGFDDLITIFNNKNKINAVIKIWNNRKQYRDEYYKCTDIESRISNLELLPHIGKITANHLARNLGEDVVKYDIWIQRLGALFADNPQLRDKIDNGKLDPEIKSACDAMFAHLVEVTGLPRGYIDVVLWKACQNGLIKF